MSRTIVIQERRFDVKRVYAWEWGGGAGVTVLLISILSSVEISPSLDGLALVGYFTMSLLFAGFVCVVVAFLFSRFEVTVPVPVRVR
jgi:hypothetical protein